MPLYLLHVLYHVTGSRQTLVFERPDVRAYALIAMSGQDVTLWCEDRT